MALPRFFKLGKAKQFTYKPLYYNQQKEELQERIKSIEAEFKGKNAANGEYVSRLRKGYLREQTRKNTKGRRVSNVRIVIILVLLLIAAYYYLYY